MPIVRKMTCVALMLIAGIGLAHAENQIFRLEPRKVEGIPNGKAVLIDGKAGPESHRFFLEQMNMLIPVVVTLKPVNPQDKVRLMISKFSWTQPLRDGVTDGKPVSFKFRTEGEFQVQVSSEQPGTPYKMIVWVGDELKPDFKPVIVKKSEYTEKSAGDAASAIGGGTLVTWIIAAALVGIFALLAVLVFRRKAS